MKQVLGQPVSGGDFFDREYERAAAWRKLQADSLLMLAPRRVGKTSLMFALQAEAPEHGFAAISCSFAACNDELDCINQLSKALGEHPSARKLVSKLKKQLKPFKNIKIVGVQFEMTETDRSLWREIGEAITTSLAESNENWLICVDEVPVFLLKLLSEQDGQQRASGFLNWFRDLRQKNHKKVRWILAGSIGMDTLTARHRLGGTINDLFPFPLGAFGEATADRFLSELAQSYSIELSQETRAEIISIIGWPLPYYLQLMFDQLREQHELKQKTLTTTDVQTAFENLLKPTHKSYFDYWRQRLDDELGANDAKHAIALLNHACGDPNGVTRDTLRQVLMPHIADEDQRAELFRYLLEVLESDGYLHELNGRWRFRLAWLREYWKRRVAP